MTVRQAEPPTVVSVLSTQRAPRRWRAPRELVGVAAASLAGLIALVDGPPPGVRLALLLISAVAPGLAVLAFYELPTSARRVLAPVVGVSVQVLVSTICAFAHIWAPEAREIAIGAVSLVMVGLAGLRSTVAPSTSWTSLRRRIATWRSTAARPSRPVLVSAAVTTVGLTAWAAALPSVGHAPVSSYGLLVAASPLLVGALVLVGAGFVAALRARSVGALAYAAVALVVVERLTTTIGSAVPIYPWTYKHIGVVSYVLHYHHVTRGLDIYNDWPGFFSTVAWWSHVSTVSPTTIAHFFTPAVHLAALPLMYAVARAWQLERLAAATAAFVFEAVSFIQQDYFSPQAGAYLLALGVLVTLGLSRDRRVAVVPSLIVFAAVTVTHQLTPYWLLLVVVLLVVLRRVRPWYLPVLYGAMALSYLAWNYATVKHYSNLVSLDPVENVRLGARATPVFGIRTQFYLTALICAVLFLVAGTLLLVRWRRGQDSRALAAISFGPLLIVLVQGYGGESVFRVMLFAIPGLALSLAPNLAAVAQRARITQVVLGLASTVLLVASAQAYLGSWSAYRVSKSELAVQQAFLSKAPARARFLPLGIGWPSRPTWQYAFHATNLYDYDYPLYTGDFHIADDYASQSSYDELYAVLHAYAVRYGSVYVALSASSAVYQQLYGVLPATAQANLEHHFLADPRVRLVAQQDDAHLFLVQ